MVIDPRLYEKLSGRKGDPYDRLGQALAQSEQSKADRETRREQIRMSRGMPFEWKLWIMNPKVAAVVVGIVLLLAAIGALKKLL